MIRKLLNALAALWVTTISAWALTQIITTPLPFVFTPGTTISSSQMNTNFSTVASQVNAFQTGGSWVPVDNSGASLVFTGVNANYTQIGNMVYAYAQLTYPSTGSVANASIGGLPFASANFPSAKQCTVSNNMSSIGLQTVPGTTTANWVTAQGFAVSNTGIALSTFNFMCIYPIS